MEHLISVLNSNEDVPIDSSSHIVLGAIKYLRGGKGSKFTSLHEKITKKKSIARIENKDNLCLVRAVQVSFASVRKTSDVELNKCKSDNPHWAGEKFSSDFTNAPPAIIKRSATTREIFKIC